MIPSLIVSVTSHPPRFGSLRESLRSLLQQDVRPTSVVLWLAPDELAQLPEAVLKLDGLTIRQCETIRSYQKLVPALRAYPEAHILTADDDLVYPRSWVRSFVDAYQGTREILVRRGRQIVSDAAYEAWPVI